MVSIIPFHLLCHNLWGLTLSISQPKHEGAERLKFLLKLAHLAHVGKECVAPAIITFFIKQSKYQEACADKGIFGG